MKKKKNYDLHKRHSGPHFIIIIKCRFSTQCYMLRVYLLIEQFARKKKPSLLQANDREKPNKELKCSRHGSNSKVNLYSLMLALQRHNVQLNGAVCAICHNLRKAKRGIFEKK